MINKLENLSHQILNRIYTVVGQSSKDEQGSVAPSNVRELNVLITINIRTRVIFVGEKSNKMYEADASDDRKEQTNPNLIQRVKIKVLISVLTYSLVYSLLLRREKRHGLAHRLGFEAEGI